MHLPCSRKAAYLDKGTRCASVSPCTMSTWLHSLRKKDSDIPDLPRCPKYRKWPRGRRFPFLGWISQGNNRGSGTPGTPGSQNNIKPIKSIKICMCVYIYIYIFIILLSVCGICSRFLSGRQSWHAYRLLSSEIPPGFMEEVNQKAEVGDKWNAEIRPLGMAVSPRARSTLLIKALSSGSGIHYSPLSHYNRMYMVTSTYFYIVYCYPVIRSTIEKVYN